jgi:hypothetical protein
VSVEIWSVRVPSEAMRYEILGEKVELAEGT